jgi:hypothetical protein
MSARAIDEQAEQPQLTDRALGFARGAIAVERIDRSEPVNPTGLPGNERGHVIVDLHDGVVRHEPFGIGDQAGRDVDHATCKMAVVDILYQARFIGELRRDRLPSAALGRRREPPRRHLEAGRNMVAVEIDDG